MSRRVVFTGIGVVAPTGIGVDAHWHATLHPTCRIRPIQRPDLDPLPIQVAGEVTDFVESERVPSKIRVQTDRWTHFALAGAELALADAALRPAEHPRWWLSVVTSSASGGNEFGQREIQALWSRHPNKVSAYQSIGWFYAASTGQISIRHGATGGCGVVVSDGAGGLDALKQAWRTIRQGGKAVLVGGTEAALSPYAVACLSSLPTLSTAADPATAYRPFHPWADGWVVGEGGAMLTLEDAEFARSRGARPYAELLGHAATHDSYHHTRPAPEGEALATAMELALQRAGRSPEDVDVVFADGAGDRAGDAAEAAALRRVFGDRLDQVPVTVPKTMVGRLMSGGGALDVAWACLALQTSVIPPTVNADVAATSARYGISLVTRPLAVRRLATALVVARGVGGFNSAVVLGLP
jgi:3-oxoacyl-(acyl-carrier-protein) synthase